MSRIFIAGHNGMVGSSIYRLLKKTGNHKIIVRDRKQLDLTNQKDVNSFFKRNKIDKVFLAAAKVGGIHANNSYPAEFIYENIMIEANIIHASFLYGVKQLLFLGSSCIYPKKAKQPISEQALLSGFLEETNKAYAIAKIAGIILCSSYNKQYSKKHKVDFRCVMPTNLYGPGDNFDMENGHVIPALLRRFHEAKVLNKKSINVWGTGEPIREFLYVDDLARACIKLIDLNKKNFQKLTNSKINYINVGSGESLSIKQLAFLIKKIVKFKGIIKFDKTKPDGTMVKILDSRILNSLKWKAKVKLESGLLKTYNYFKKQYG